MIKKFKEGDRVRMILPQLHLHNRSGVVFCISKGINTVHVCSIYVIHSKSEKGTDIGLWLSPKDLEIDKQYYRNERLNKILKDEK
jgi:hypothetical protein